MMTEETEDVHGNGAYVFEFEPYRVERKDAWDDFVKRSRNGTFLFDRAFMDYHADRFTDASWLVLAGSEVVALFPANRVGDQVVSHGGLTYGGFVLGMHSGAAFMLELFDRFFGFLFASGVRQVIYKTIPSIYHRIPAEEDRYALFRMGARLVRRDALSVVPADAQQLPKALRRPITQRARSTPGLSIAVSDRWEEYWDLLERQLAERYDTRPVHTVDEMRLLAKSFPEEITLLSAEVNGTLVAGAVLFETPTVVHAQYLAADGTSRRLGLLDLVLERAISEAQASGKYFDFGISTLDNGKILNEGLSAYKESFGARTVVQDFYEINRSPSGA